MLAKTLVDHHYKDVASLAQAIAARSPTRSRIAKRTSSNSTKANLPGSPDEWPWAAQAINTVLAAVKGKAAVHLCFGNYGGQAVQRGTWGKLMGYLNSLKADHIVMENAHRPAEELAVFRELDPRIGMGPGRGRHQAHRGREPRPDRAGDERAEGLLGAGRVRYIHPDCGFWMLKRSIADAKIRALVAGRDLFEGRGGAQVA